MYTTALNDFAGLAGPFDTVRDAVAASRAGVALAIQRVQAQDRDAVGLSDTAWKAAEWEKISDCVCAGGTWKDGDCVPGAQTCKRFDPATRGCLSVSGCTVPEIPGWCNKNGVNWCLVGGIAVGVMLLALLARKNA